MRITIIGWMTILNLYLVLTMVNDMLNTAYDTVHTSWLDTTMTQSRTGWFFIFYLSVFESGWDIIQKNGYATTSCKTTWKARTTTLATEFYWWWNAGSHWWSLERVMGEEPTIHPSLWLVLGHYHCHTIMGIHDTYSYTLVGYIIVAILLAITTLKNIFTIIHYCHRHHCYLLFTHRA